MTSNDAISAINITLDKSDSLLEMLYERQRRILKHLPNFARVTLAVAVMGFLATSIVQWFSGINPVERLGLVTLSQPTLGVVISFLLTLFSVLVMWVFVIWSLSFIPFIVYHAYKVSQQSKVAIGNRAFRWLQLYAATFLPMATFAVVWTSVPTENNVVFQLNSLSEIVLILSGTVVIALALWGLNSQIPPRFVAVRIALLSTMLYASLFLTYGLGYNLISYTTLLGILTYLTFGAGELEKVGRRLITYDIDPEIAEKISKLATKNQDVKSKKDEVRIRKVDLEITKIEQQYDIEAVQAENEAGLNEQLANILKTKADINKQTSQAKLRMLQQKYELLQSLHESLSKELEEKMEKALPEIIRQWKNDMKDATPGVLQDKMNNLLSKISYETAGIPESLDEVRNEMLQVTNEIQNQVQHLIEERTQTSKEDSVQMTDEE